MEYTSVTDVLEDVPFWNSLSLYGANLHRANLLGADLSGANLYSANLRGADLHSANLRYANLNSANLYSADLSSANLHRADLHRANLRYANLNSADLHRNNLDKANLRDANLDRANLNRASLRSADLSGADLCSADLYGADLYGANLRGADLRGADLRDANLSQSKGLLTAKSWLQQFKKDEQGILVYRCESGYRSKPDSWNIEPGAFLEDMPNFDRCLDCACGVSFATREWIEKEFDAPVIWLCRILWEDLADVVVPYNTDGKARCARLQLVKKILDA
jgi:hypothetical protein